MKTLLFLSFVLLSFRAQAFDHDHKAFTEILQDFTTTKNRQTWVHYGKLNNEGRKSLQSYLKTLSSVKKDEYESWGKDQRLAFLINAYNAFTLEWILIHRPKKSIKDTGSFFSSPWSKTFPDYELLGDNFTLDSIEHGRIRKNFREPRIHFAVNCASIGCPSLHREAFRARELESQLKDTEKAFFKNPEKYRFNGKVAKVSSILDWYGSDFRNVHKSLENYLRKNDPSLPREFKIEFLDYDWSLNGDWK